MFKTNFVLFVVIKCVYRRKILFVQENAPRSCSSLYVRHLDSTRSIRDVSFFLLANGTFGDGGLGFCYLAGNKLINITICTYKHNIIYISVVVRNNVMPNCQKLFPYTQVSVYSHIFTVAWFNRLHT